MEIIIKADMTARTSLSANTSDSDFERNRLLVQENEISQYIGTTCLNAILALNRDSTTDQAKELYSFWSNFVKTYVVYKVFQLFVETHGYNFGQAGILQPPSGPNTSTPVTIQERSSLAKQYEKFASNALTKMKNEFSDRGGVFDEVTYVLDQNVSNESPASIGMTAVGNVRTNITYKRTRRI